MKAVRTKVTSNGQVSLPAELRHRWRSPAVLVIDKGNYAIVRPIPDDPVSALRGSHAGTGPASDRVRADERAADAAREETRIT
ncbi:MAG: AbrB/MazE/SpoVT family DNA-binding domain-containing protein [Pseudonocardiaceae bacterium]